MIDLNNGIIELNGIVFCRDISIDTLLHNHYFSLHSHSDSNGFTFDRFTLESVVVDEYTFKVKVLFLNGRIEKLQLFPINIGIEDPGYPNKEYQEIKKSVVDSFLRTRLGEPHKKNECVLYYGFEWGSISSVVFLSGRNEYTGGFIDLSYKPC